MFLPVICITIRIILYSHLECQLIYLSHWTITSIFQSGCRNPFSRLAYRIILDLKIIPINLTSNRYNRWCSLSFGDYWLDLQFIFHRSNTVHLYLVIPTISACSSRIERRVEALFGLRQLPQLQLQLILRLQRLCCLGWIIFFQDQFLDQFAISEFGYIA